MNGKWRKGLATLVPVLAIFLLAACGGGGGGGANNNANASPTGSNWDQLVWDRDSWN